MVWYRPRVPLPWPASHLHVPKNYLSYTELMFWIPYSTRSIFFFLLQALNFHLKRATNLLMLIKNLFLSANQWSCNQSISPKKVGALFGRVAKSQDWQSRHKWFKLPCPVGNFSSWLCLASWSFPVTRLFFSMHQGPRTQDADVTRSLVQGFLSLTVTLDKR